MGKPLHKLIDESLHSRLVMDYTYEPGTGLWRFNRSRGRYKHGMTAGHMDAAGYRKISFNGKTYASTRLAYFYMTGKSPPQDLDMDHINRIQGDDRWCNLRLATRQENNLNKIGKAKGLRAPRKKGDRFIPPLKLPEFEDVGDAINFAREAEALLAPLMRKYGVETLGKVIPIPSSKKLIDSPPRGLWDEPPSRRWLTNDGIWTKSSRITNMNYLLEVG